MSIFLNKTIRLFLDSIGRREEYEYYLERFSGDRSRAFAVLVPELDGLSDSASVFVFDMRFLLRLGLDPIVLLTGPDADLTVALFQAEGDCPFHFRTLEQGLDAVDAHDLMVHLESTRNAGKSLVLIDRMNSAEDALDRLVPDLTRRVHFIRVRGPLHDRQGNPLYFYQQTPAHAEPVIADGDRELAELAVRLVEKKPGLHLSVASPLRLLEELFTVKGAGCVVRRGAVIVSVPDIEALDSERLVTLLESSFGKALCRRTFLQTSSSFLVEQDYKGAAILEPFESMMYLSKFAVDVAARGEGLAQELWRTVVGRYPAIFWRSSLKNPINHWYDRQSDGHHCVGEWRIYWRGVDVCSIPKIIANAQSRLPDFC